MILRDQQIGSAVVVVIAGNDRSRMFEMNLVEADVGSDIFESIGTKIAKQFDLALTIFVFADRHQIDPAIFVVIQGGNAVGTDPIPLGKFDAIKAFAMIVAPETNSGRVQVCECQVHPAVMIEVKNCHACCLRWHGRGPEFTSNKLPLSRVLINQRSRESVHLFIGGAGAHARCNNVNSAIIVVIGTDAREVRSAAVKCQRLRNVGKCAVPIVTPHRISTG